MSRWGAANYCCVCEKTIPHSARCVYCRIGLCYTCQCPCRLAQPNAIPMNPNTGGIGPIPDAKKS